MRKNIISFKSVQRAYSTADFPKHSFYEPEKTKAKNINNKKMKISVNLRKV